MIRNLPKSLLYAATALIFPAASSHASPFIHVTIEGRVGSAGPFSSSLTLLPNPGQTIEYRVLYDMAPVGTTNFNAVTDFNPNGRINSLTFAPTVVDSKSGQTVSNPFGDGINALTIDLFQLSTDPSQVDLNNAARSTINTDPTPFTLDSWIDGTGSSGGGLVPRLGVPQDPTARDRINIRTIHQAGVQTAVDPEQGFTGTFVVRTFGGPSQLRARFTPGSSGLIKINGTAEPIFITDESETSSDPFTAFTPLTIIHGVCDDPRLALRPGPLNFGNVLKGSIAQQPSAIDRVCVDTAAPFQIMPAGDVDVTPTSGTFPVGAAAFPITATLSTSRFGPAVGTITLVNALPAPDPDQVLSVTGNVGIATVGPLNNFGDASTAVILPGGSYAGLAARSAGQSSLENTLTILDGSNAAGGDETLAVRTRARTEDEVDTDHPFSDVFEVFGSDDPVAISMDYDPLIAQSISLTPLLGRFISGRFQLAGDPNRSPELSPFSDFGLPGLSDDIGRYGLDISTNTVWAVLSSPSQFAVIPEPSLLILLPALLLRRPRHHPEC